MVVSVRGVERREGGSGIVNSSVTVNYIAVCGTFGKLHLELLQLFHGPERS